MSAAATTTEPNTKSAATDWPGHATHVLSLVHRLIDYAKDLIGTFQQPGAITLVAHRVRLFGTAEIALILARITSGLLRAEALEARLVRIASQPDAEPKPAGASPPRTPRAGPAGPRPAEHPFLANLPSPERIAAEVSRRPIGVVIADICRELGIMPNHPLWQELCVVIRRHGGNVATLLKDIFRRVFREIPPATEPAAEPAPIGPRPATGSTGPP